MARWFRIELLDVIGIEGENVWLRGRYSGMTYARDVNNFFCHASVLISEKKGTALLL